MQWMMLQQDNPEDFVIATGKQYTIRQFLVWTAKYLDLELDFSGTGIDEVATVKSMNTKKTPGISVGDVIMRIDAKYFRPTEVETLLGDPTKAKEKLGWIPEITAEEMCKEMVESDYQNACQLSLLRENGYKVDIETE
jgi:GDPmannose 4,6-dehydratase